ncbi:hypothetical protein SH668x_000436 [Planctomicrobium sp. SH668]|uniref:hypothetical protein n=1 Tax=Planctomicrobium sp. SH668 TaxID=3448126 RepID=UPI003F5C47E1
MATPLLADEASDRVKLLPRDSNALAIVRIDQILQSERAVKEDWAKAADENFFSGAGGIPSWVKSLTIGFFVRPLELDEIWGAGVMSVPDEVTLKAISESENSTLETLVDYPALRTQTNSYLLELAHGQLGVWRPGARQEAVRWARDLKYKTTGLRSQYLETAALTSGHLILAMDLEDALDPVISAAYLELMPELKGKPDQIESVHQILNTLRGVTFTATVGKLITSELRFDFGLNVGNNAPVLKQFFSRIITDLGASIDDFDASQATPDGKSFRLKANLSEDSFSRIISLLGAPPTHQQSNHQQVAGASPSASGVNASDSRKYFDQIDKIVNNLARSAQRSNDISRTALWHEQFASKIEDLSVKGVDPELIQYAGDVATKLRGLSRSLRGQQMQVDLHQKTLTVQQDFNPGWASVNIWGGVGYSAPSVNTQSNLQQVRENQAAAIAAGAQQRDEVWQLLTQERSDVLTKMRQKYGDSF